MALDNKEQEVLWDERNVYIIYSRKDVQEAIEQSKVHIYPGNKRMKTALDVIAKHQDELVSTDESNSIAGPILVALSTLFVVLVLGLVALLKNTHTTIQYNQKDGTFELITYR
jgi:hypothetical protein